MGRRRSDGSWPLHLAPSRRSAGELLLWLAAEDRRHCSRPPCVLAYAQFGSSLLNFETNSVQFWPTSAGDRQFRANWVNIGPEFGWGSSLSGKLGQIVVLIFRSRSQQGEIPPQVGPDIPKHRRCSSSSASLGPNSDLTLPTMGHRWPERGQTRPQSSRSARLGKALAGRPVRELAFVFRDVRPNVARNVHNLWSRPPWAKHGQAGPRGNKRLCSEMFCVRKCHGISDLFSCCVSIPSSRVGGKDEFIRYTDKMTGVERVEQGPGTIVPAPTEVTDAGVQKVLWLRLGRFGCSGSPHPVLVPKP